uniref:Uncharacterized protein n=1 Tax=Rhipicephalus zambeziensis TaxID=60191 RepID=A0A224Z0T3_9ACAR
MDLVQRVFTFLTFFVCCGCLAFLTVSLATQDWIEAKPVMLVYVSNNSIQQAENEGKFKGEVSFGLFHGKKTLNYGLGPRHSTFSIKEELQKNPTLMIFGLWLVTVLGISLAVVFGLVSCIFAIVNSVMTPVEAITGRAGLYLWNTVGGWCHDGSLLSRKCRALSEVVALTVLEVTLSVFAQINPAY